jgi:hypothetical protein
VRLTLDIIAYIEGRREKEKGKRKKEKGKRKKEGNYQPCEGFALP